MHDDYGWWWGLIDRLIDADYWLIMIIAYHDDWYMMITDGGDYKKIYWLIIDSDDDLW